MSQLSLNWSRKVEADKAQKWGNMSCKSGKGQRPKLTNLYSVASIFHLNDTAYTILVFLGGGLLTRVT